MYQRTKEYVDSQNVLPDLVHGNQQNVHVSNFGYGNHDSLMLTSSHKKPRNKVECAPIFFENHNRCLLSLNMHIRSELELPKFLLKKELVTNRVQKLADQPAFNFPESHVRNYTYTS